MKFRCSDGYGLQPVMNTLSLFAIRSGRIGAVFNDKDDWPNSKTDKFGMSDDNW
jgi:hypothetical protein